MRLSIQVAVSSRRIKSYTSRNHFLPMIPSQLNRLDDPTRRQFMSGLAKTFLGVGLLPGASAFAAGGDDRQIPLRKNPAKKIIYLYMSGGMSHLDTFDPKPDADAEIRGNLSAIKTSADGVRISEYLPQLARHMDKAVVVNSLHSRTGAHAQGQYLMRTNYEKRGTIKHPHMGAWLLKYQDRINDQLPGFVAINSGSRNVGSGFFGSSYAPLVIGKPDSGLQNSAHYRGIDDTTFERRRKLAVQLDEGFHNKYNDVNAAAYTTMYDEAVTLMQSRDLDAFDLSQESQEMRDLYGDHSFGQGCLLARRLSESGTRSVEVQMGGGIPTRRTSNGCRVIPRSSTAPCPHCSVTSHPAACSRRRWSSSPPSSGARRRSTRMLAVTTTRKPSPPSSLEEG